MGARGSLRAEKKRRSPRSPPRELRTWEGNASERCPAGSCSACSWPRRSSATPKLLLLDEPLANLDIRRSRELVQTINGLVRARNVTTLLVAHDINPLIQCLDKVIYIANGKVAPELLPPSSPRRVSRPSTACR